VPLKASKHDEVRYRDIYEDNDLGEDQLACWIQQASDLPGEQLGAADLRASRSGRSFRSRSPGLGQRSPLPGVPL
jgi:hypothetical protein